MGERPLRQHYDPIDTAVDPAFGVAVVPWQRHLGRFIARLELLPDDQWRAPTRCSEWNVADVVAHLTTTYGFFAYTFGQARLGEKPGTMLRGFDPSNSPEQYIAPMRELTAREVLDDFIASTTAVTDAVTDFADTDWDALGESPLGHLQARYLFAHMFWDSWLHERDTFVAADPPPVEVDELLMMTWWSLYFAGLEGGTLEDSDPVGPGPEAPVIATLDFSDLPGNAFAVRIDTGVTITSADPTGAFAAGSALAFVEHFAGRAPATGSVLPEDLAAQCARAMQVL